MKVNQYSINCKLSNRIIAGSMNPQLYDEDGQIKEKYEGVGYYTTGVIFYNGNQRVAISTFSKPIKVKQHLKTIKIQFNVI